MTSSKHVSAQMDGGVLVIRFVNEASRNSMTAEFRNQLGDALSGAARDPAVRAVYITGQGTAFCSGGDLHMLKNESDPWSVHQRFQRLGAWFLSFLQFPKPVVVGVNGFAVGGGIGIALAGDLIYAADDAKFIPGFFRLGVVPDVGTMYTLPRLIGMARAKRFLFGNEPMGAQEAHDCGLVARIVPRAALDEAGLAKARELAEGPAAVMGLAKSLLARSFETGMNEMFMLEAFGQGLAMSSGEFREGLAAMLEKRPARFTEAEKQGETGDRRGKR
jgi:2-(1,2-epoxy-1,2-dihydrophenyl)acetyl-CoA isomerase